jgi:hypothetical protein
MVRDTTTGPEADRYSASFECVKERGCRLPTSASVGDADPHIWCLSNEVEESHAVT